jgi:hypothetical protein
VIAWAESTSIVTSIHISVDDTKVWEEQSNELDTPVNLSLGNHRITVVAKDAGGYFWKTVYATVSNPPPSCTPSGPDPSVTICTPRNGETVASPVHITAAPTSSLAVTRMHISVDGVKKYEVADDRIDTTLEMNTGARRITVTARNSAGNYFWKTVYVTVSGNPDGITVSPSSAILSPGASQQFTANMDVTWAVDGISGGNTTVGTISSSGLYVAPSATGSHTITATSVADASKSGQASVQVTTFAGVLTYHNDNARTGQNVNEQILTPANVNKNTFGRRFSFKVDGYVFAQPLYVPNVSIAGKGTFNVVYVATQFNSVYAFDADGKISTPLWKKSLNNGFEPMSSTDVATSNSGPWVGITGTPVIDRASNTLYVVAATDEGGSFHHRLHALDIGTGAEEFGGPADVRSCVPGTGYDNQNGSVCFKPKRQNQRPALLLHKGVVYIGFGSHHVNDPWHGWLFAYDAATLRQLAVFNTTANDKHGGIWQGGGGPAADADGFLYMATGQGTFNASRASYGDTLVKLDPGTGSSLVVDDYFTPYNQSQMNINDLDFGSGGVLLLPDQGGTSHPKLVLAVNKQGNIYLVDRENMGRFQAGSDSQIVQALYGVVGGAQRGTPAYWNGYVYFAGQGSVLKAFRLRDGLLSGSPSSRSTVTLRSYGAVPTVSANRISNGVVWLLNRGGGQPGVLYAHDATDVSRVLYHSEQVPTRDRLGFGTKFSVPTVANGKVYVGTNSELVVYGLLQ